MHLESHNSSIVTAWQSSSEGRSLDLWKPPTVQEAFHVQPVPGHASSVAPIAMGDELVYLSMCFSGKF